MWLDVTLGLPFEDGLVQGIAKLPKLFGREVLAPYQNGLIQFYVAVSALGVAILFLLLLL